MKTESANGLFRSFIRSENVLCSAIVPPAIPPNPNAKANTAIFARDASQVQVQELSITDVPSPIAQPEASPSQQTDRREWINHLSELRTE